MANKSEFFQDDEGCYSAMRLYCFLALCQAIALSWYGIKYNMINDITPMVWTFMIGAFAPKAIQKFAEVWLKEKLFSNINPENQPPAQP